jgi:hypothetical protein
MHSDADTPAAPARQSLRRYAFLLAGLILLGLLVRHFGWAPLRDALLAAEPLPLIAMTLLIIAGFWIRAIKWVYALPPRSGATTLFFLAKVGGNWTPGRVGELAPLLLREHRNARMLAWVLVDRVIEVAFTLWLGALGLYALGLLNLPATLAILLAGPLLAGSAIILVLRRKFPAPVGGPRRQWIANALAQLQAAMRLLGARVPVILLLTAAAKVTDIYAVVLLCTAFGYDVSFLLVCAARCAHALVAAIPMTPDATGVPFVAAAWLLHEHAAVPYPVLTAALALELLIINAVLHASFVLSSWGWKVDNSPLPDV